MADINFQDLNIKMDIAKKTFDFNGVTIEVSQYASIKDKYDIIMTALQKSDEKGIYNIVKMQMYFELNIVYIYTNLTFSSEDRADEAELYDKLMVSGLLEKILKEIPEEEYNEMYNNLTELYSLIMKYRNTAGAVIQSMIRDLPKQAAAAKDIVDNFDPSKFQSIMNFVTAANGGRPIT